MLFGFAAATLVAAFLHAPSAHAQERSGSDQTQASSRDQTSARSAAEADPVTAYETPMKTPRLRGTEAESSDNAADTERDGDDDEQDDPTAASAGATDEPIDGDIARDGSVAADGVIDLGEPQAPTTAPTRTRVRPRTATSSSIPRPDTTRCCSRSRTSTPP
jgi:hypothetical protein